MTKWTWNFDTNEYIDETGFIIPAKNIEALTRLSSLSGNRDWILNSVKKLVIEGKITSNNYIVEP